MELESKIIKVGKSSGIIIPQEVLDHTKTKQGDTFKFYLQEDGTAIVKKAADLNVEALGDLDQDFIDGVADLFGNYDNTLKNLADR